MSDVRCAMFFLEETRVIRDENLPTEDGSSMLWVDLDTVLVSPALFDAIRAEVACA